MRRLAVSGLFALGGAAAGGTVVSGNHLLGGIMGAVLGLTCAIIVHAFPRDRDYPGYDGFRQD